MEEKLAAEIMESHYKIIIEGLIGAHSLQLAKEIGCVEFIRAKHCALLSVNKILELPIGKVKVNRQWLEVKSRIETF